MKSTTTSSHVPDGHRAATIAVHARSLRENASNVLRRARVAAVAFIGTVIMASALLAPSTASAAVTEHPYNGNKNCPSSLREIRIDPVNSGTYTVGGVSITVTLDSLPLGPGFDWSATGGTVSSVFVKGGPVGIEYRYNPAATSGQDLHSQINPSNGRYYGLSHISFCYTPGVASIDVIKACADQVVDGESVKATNTVTIINNGDFALTNISLEEVTTSFTSCTLTAVNGSPTSTALVPGQKTAVPGITSLAVGAEIVATVECSGVAADIQNTIKAYGTHAGGEIFDNSTSDPANTLVCALPPPTLAVEKDCPADTDVRLIAKDNGFVVEVCPTIKVTNTGTETLEDVTITDAQLPGSPFMVGTLAPTASTSVRACYVPSPTAVSPAGIEQVVQDDDGQPYWDASTASFFNMATAIGTGKFTKVTTDPGSDTASGDECKLCPCMDCE